MQVGFEGVTGNVAFDDMGNRVNYTISIYSGQGETLEQLVRKTIELKFKIQLQKENVNYKCVAHTVKVKDYPIFLFFYFFYIFFIKVINGCVS